MISKIFVMFRSLQTRESWPSFERSRLTPPTSTPSVVESMNVVLREVDDDVLPALPDHLEQLLLELRRRVQVDLARERDDVLVVAQLLGLDVEVHAVSPPALGVGRPGYYFFFFAGAAGAGESCLISASIWLRLVDSGLSLR